MPHFAGALPRPPAKSRCDQPPWTVSKTPLALVRPAVAFRSSIFRHKSDVIPRNERVVILRCRQTRDIIGMFTNEFGSVGAGIIHNASSDLVSIRAHDRNDIA